jgi:pseudouridine kinase
MQERHMSVEPSVLVIGASGIDIKGRALEPIQMGTANRGLIRSSIGGVARNIAENLVRLEVPTILLSAVGQDEQGDYLLSRTAAAGVDTRYVLRLPDVHTGSYAVIQDHTGQITISIGDYDIINAISPAYLQERHELFAQSAMIVIDANLSAKSITTVFRLAKRYDVPVCADPTTALLASKLLKYLPSLKMVAPDAAEAAKLCGLETAPTSSETAIATAQCLVNKGVQIGIVTLAEQGLAYANSSSAGHIPALHTQVVDTTGVGDALTAAVIFGLINDFPLDEAVRLGISAAALTLRTRETVSSDLSLDRLYDELVI